jgi:hypothetical protein
VEEMREVGIIKYKEENQVRNKLSKRETKLM